MNAFPWRPYEFVFFVPMVIWKLFKFLISQQTRTRRIRGDGRRRKKRFLKGETETTRTMERENGVLETDGSGKLDRRKEVKKKVEIVIWQREVKRQGWRIAGLSMKTDCCCFYLQVWGIEQSSSNLKFIAKCTATQYVYPSVHPSIHPSIQLSVLCPWCLRSFVPVLQTKDPGSWFRLLFLCFFRAQWVEQAFSNLLFIISFHCKPRTHKENHIYSCRGSVFMSFQK